jgi:hypothetical protein
MKSFFVSSPLFPRGWVEIRSEKSGLEEVAVEYVKSFGVNDSMDDDALLMIKDGDADEVGTFKLNDLISGGTKVEAPVVSKKKAKDPEPVVEVPVEVPVVETPPIEEDVV